MYYIYIHELTNEKSEHNHEYHIYHLIPPHILINFKQKW